MTFVADKSGNTPTDKPWTFANRTVAGDPNTTGPLTPQYAGEIVSDTANHALWKATGTTNTSWVALTPPYST